ncbi:WD40 repeat domain-containing protein [Actinomadura napierensis]|uniref:WD40 repeat domain-containing protein n=1 Tax=Actinomadura napierensis TaxID=267854 RepID=A0ABP5KPX9_9ACTN
MLITGGHDGMVGVWDLRSGQRTAWWETGDKEPARGVALTSVDGRPVAVAGGESGQVQVWALDDTDRPLIATLPVHEERINALDRRDHAAGKGLDGLMLGLVTCRRP